MRELGAVFGEHFSDLRVVGGPVVAHLLCVTPMVASFVSRCVLVVPVMLCGVAIFFGIVGQCCR